MYVGGVSLDIPVAIAPAFVLCRTPVDGVGVLAVLVILNGPGHIAGIAVVWKHGQPGPASGAIPALGIKHGKGGRTIARSQDVGAIRAVHRVNRAVLAAAVLGPIATQGAGFITGVKGGPEETADPVLADSGHDILHRLDTELQGH